MFGVVKAAFLFANGIPSVELAGFVVGDVRVGRGSEVGVEFGIAVGDGEMVDVFQIMGCEDTAPVIDGHAESGGGGAEELDLACFEVELDIAIPDRGGLVRVIRPEEGSGVTAIAGVDPVVESVDEAVDVVLCVADGEA